MTTPITGLNIIINPDGTGTLNAPDFSVEGHLWAIKSRPVSLETLREVASLLGDDVRSAVDARLQVELQNAEHEVEHLRSLIAQADAAARRANVLREALG